MSDRGGYGQFCPISMASEVICTRWTTLILREFLCGSARFNELRRGLPKLSPALLSKRLKELEEAGVIATIDLGTGGSEYRLTPMGRDLEPLILGLGDWGHRWIESRLSLKNLDPSLLMWDMRRRLRPDPLPERRCTIQFLYPELVEGDRLWWLVVDKGEVDLCKIDPGFEVDLMITGSLRSMTSVWMGITSLAEERGAGRVAIDGDRTIARTIDSWLGLSHYAPLTRKVA